MEPEPKVSVRNEDDAHCYQLLPDEYFEEEDTVDHATVFQDIKAGLENAIAWERGEGEQRVTIMAENGQRLEPEMMTRQQYEQRRMERNADKVAAPASEAFLLLAQLLTWTGRAAATPEETEQVRALRQRAETLLQQAGVRELVSSA